MNKCNVLNRTIFLHDNLEILQGINSDCIDLIYLDPPFNKNKIFSAPIGSSAEGAEFSDIFREEDVKTEWLQTIKEDHHELYQYLNGIKGVGKPYNFAYLAYMAVRLIECHRILKDTGSLYLHCDPTMSHYLKTTLDCVFGERFFRNEIVWCYPPGGKAPKYGLHRKHDVIFYYSKGSRPNFHHWYRPLTEYQMSKFTSIDRDGRKFKEYRGKTRTYLDELPGSPIPDWWTDVPSLGQTISKERVGYPTQKPLALLDRIIKASSNEGDIVLDPFCGCATTCVAAENNGRQWIGIDVSIKAYELVKERLEKEVARPDALPTYRNEIHLKSDPPVPSDISASIENVKDVYIISHRAYPGEYKVGIARDAKARLKSYQIGDPERNYKLEFSHKTHLYRETEAHIHEHFDNKHEWVKGSIEEIKREIMNYIEESKHG